MPSSAEPPSAVSSPPRAAPASKPDRHFHVIAAIVLIGLILTGFHHFYFHGRAYPGRPITPPIRNLIVAHGSLMAVWILVFLFQSLLILGNRRAIHRKIGSLAGVIAGAAVLLGLKLGIEAARVKPPGMLVDGLTATQFMAIPVLSVLVFGGCVAAAIIFRRNPSLHRTLMLIGTLSAMTAAVARIDFLSNLYAGTVFARIWGPFFMTAVLAFLLLVLKAALARKFDRKLAVGAVGLTLVLAFINQFATTGIWDGIAQFLLRVTA
jgi:hypothetical protein